MNFDFATWWEASGTSIVRALIIILLALITGFALRKFADRMARKAEQIDDRRSAQRQQTLSVFLRSAVRVLVIGLAAVLILAEFGVEIGPILAAAGVAGIAIGFGAQTLVQDFLGGLFLLTEGYVRVGDVVQVNDKAGLVEEVSMRLLVLREFGGNVHVIPNGEIRTITHMTYQYSRALIDVGVAYREDSDHVVRIMEEEGKALAEEMSDVITEGPEIFGIDSFGDSAINWRVRFTTKPIQQWGVARAYRRRLKARFDAEHIEIPFPHRTLYMGESHDGSAPFLHVKRYDPNGTKPEGHAGVAPEDPTPHPSTSRPTGDYPGADVEERPDEEEGEEKG